MTAALAAQTFGHGIAVALSPDGTIVAQTLCDARRLVAPGSDQFIYFSSTGVPRTLLGCQISLVDVSSGRVRIPMRAPASSFSPAWSPDGRSLAFYSDRHGVLEVWLWDTEHDAVRRVSRWIARPGTGLDVPQWSPDGQSLVVKVLPEGVSVEEANRTIVANPDTFVTQRTPVTSVVSVWTSGDTLLRSGRDLRPADLNPADAINVADLAVIDLAGNRSRRLVRRAVIRGYWTAPRGRSVSCATLIGYETARSVHGTEQALGRISVFSMDGGPARVLAEGVRIGGAGGGAILSWSPDATHIVYQTSGRLAREDWYLSGLAGSPALNLTPEPHESWSVSFRGPIWSADGTAFYLLGSDAVWRVPVVGGGPVKVAAIAGRNLLDMRATRGGQVADDLVYIVTRASTTKEEGVHTLDLETGAISKLVEEAASYVGSPAFTAAMRLDISTDGSRVVFILETASRPPDLWLADRRLVNRRQLTHNNPSLEEYEFGKSELVTWKSGDGEVLYGALLLPPGHVAGRRYPTVVYPYVGTARSDALNQFGLASPGNGAENMHVLATRGYAVFFPDAPIANGLRRAPLAEAVVAGVDRVIALGIADPERLVLRGHSLGGFTALSVLEQSNKFRAAVITGARGLDLISAYGQMYRNGASFGPGFVEDFPFSMKAAPWSASSAYVANSPLMHLDNVRVPVLLMYGALDAAQNQADEIFVGLRRLKRKVTYVKYLHEYHWQGDFGYGDQLDHWTRILDWLDRYARAGNDRGR